MRPAPHIAVVGSANVDLTIFSDRLPRPGETILGDRFQLGFGGKGANQAVAARLCGARVSMVARVGEDLFGPATVSNLAARGIDVSHVHVTPGVATGVAPIFVDHAGQNRILVVKGANDCVVPADIDAAADLLRQATCIILQLEIPLETVYYTLRFARRHGICSILNPAPGQPLDLAQLDHVDFLIPNETEAETITGKPVTNADQARACAEDLLRGGIKGVIVTLGAKGVLCATAERLERVAPYPIVPVDTTGAGDAFVGSFACFLASGHTYSQAAARANVYAALSTLSVGTQSSFVNLDRFEVAWQDHVRATR